MVNNLDHIYFLISDRTDEIIALNKKSSSQNTPGRGRGRGQRRWRGRGRGGAGNRGRGLLRGQSVKTQVSSCAHMKHTQTYQCYVIPTWRLTIPHYVPC